MVESLRLQQRQEFQLKTSRGYQTQISIIMVMLAVVVMTYIGIRHLNEEWGKYALMQASFGLVGYIGMQLSSGQGIFPRKEEYPTFKSPSPLIMFGKPVMISYGTNFILATSFGLASILVGQLIARYTLTITTTEQAFYYVFASVCEEMAFRGLLIEMVLSINLLVAETPFEERIFTRITAIVLSAVIFALVHVNYYGSAIDLISVAIMGCVLATDYVIFRNITACIIIHFIINTLATGQWLVSL